jgi:hypothetical protein
MGEVYRADDLKLAQPVALKFLPEALERRPAAVDRLLAEIRTARRVTHPNVCRVHDVGDLGGRPFFSMEYVDGEDLASLLRRIGRLPRDKAVEVVRQICAGLAAAHDAGILHRDLKPANIMLDGRGRVRLTDFGLGAALDEVAAGTLEVAGTPAYMAPEQLAGAALSVQTDLYALGLVLHELFTGRRVHDVSGMKELRERHRQSAEDKIRDEAADLDADTARVIASCLDPDPRRRPASALAVAAALPGGDPLAAALAAGRTPSPQAVAAAGEEGGLSPAVALPLVAALLGALLLASTLQRHAFYIGQVALPHPPIVLAVKAQEMLARLGHERPPADRAYGFREDPEYYRWTLARDPLPAAWSGLADLRPPVVTFLHRGSPRPLTPASYSHMFGGLAVRPDDPPRDLSGMTYLELDPAGRLVSLECRDEESVRIRRLRRADGAHRPHELRAGRKQAERQGCLNGNQRRSCS